jgi:hypothetical protein
MPQHKRRDRHGRDRDVGEGTAEDHRRASCSGLPQTTGVWCRSDRRRGIAGVASRRSLEP